MPPFLPRRKRSTPPNSPEPLRSKRARLADALDAEATNNVPSLDKAKTFSLGSDGSSSSSSLSDVDSEQFEDISIHHEQANVSSQESQNDDDEDDDIEWEDAAKITVPSQQPAHVPLANGPIEINLRKENEHALNYGYAAKAAGGKKGPSKREKHVRVLTHQLHVQFLLLHNAIRNNWIGDKKVQEILIKQLPSQINKEIDKWRNSSGLALPNTEQGAANKEKKKARGRKNGHSERHQRDWGTPSQRLEPGKPDMSHGDPLISLMKVLSAYWKKRFAITAPGLRKRGYGSRFELRQEIDSLKTGPYDLERHGERIRDIAEFRKMAEICEGSRDVGAQLFTALLRGLGIEARLVASLQPSGFGWTKNEQMIPKSTINASNHEPSSAGLRPNPQSSTQARNARSNDGAMPPAEQSSPPNKIEVVNLDADDRNSHDETSGSEIEDDESVVDVTPSLPKQRKPRYDRDLLFPIYWTEAVSPITNKVLPVSPLVLTSPVASTPEVLSTFEPRGAKAEKARQVMAYVVAYSNDGTAKDVTVRYLRKSIWPGKTKGFRISNEKIPVYDKGGRIKRYEDFDWFKATLIPYMRPDGKRTAVDDLENSTDLVPQRPENKGESEGIDTLQSLKNSTEFILERFLRREEALQPGSRPVRSFVSGKGDKQKEEPVFRRTDVERCLTAESWHKEGRRPKVGETPMKMVPVRAVTLTRKREAEEHERQYGEKQMQGLYSRDQTEWIIPPPIKDGIIPKNSYGNMDCFVPSMVPRGAVHVPLRGTVRICKKLEIDFAEAVTGFEFGNKRAVPVCTGVVVAVQHERLVKDAWHEWNEEQKRKEDTKMEKLVLDLWRKFVLGLRIRERVQDMYGEDVSVAQHSSTGLSRDEAIAIDDDDEHESNAGGFIDEHQDRDLGGGFLLPQEEESAPVEDLIMEEQPEPSPLPGSSNRADGSDMENGSSASLSSLHEDEQSLSTANSEDDLNSTDSAFELDTHSARNTDFERDSRMVAVTSGRTSKTRSHAATTRPRGQFSLTVPTKPFKHHDQSNSESSMRSTSSFSKPKHGSDHSDVTDNDLDASGSEVVGHYPHRSMRTRKSTRVAAQSSKKKGPATTRSLKGQSTSKTMIDPNNGDDEESDMSPARSRVKSRKSAIETPLTTDEKLLIAKHKPGRLTRQSKRNKAPTTSHYFHSDDGE